MTLVNRDDLDGHLLTLSTRACPLIFHPGIGVPVEFGILREVIEGVSVRARGVIFGGDLGAAG
ncbi:hypothetical protein, partial [Blastomonas sp. CCH9-F3]|uniref:hypothetical protein n=1 Tax=Blastomonas sp. CCH9-F3 TaxID=1768734 RepID=UPI001E626548